MDCNGRCIADLKSVQCGFESQLDRGNPARRRVAHKKNGKRCRKWAIRGGTVCTHHGGSAPQTKHRARERIELALELVAMRVIGFAIDAGVPPQVALAAAKDILDRGGITAKQALELSAATTEPKPYEEMLMRVTGIEKITRAEHHARLGLPTPETPELPPPRGARELPPARMAPRAAEVVDAELVPGPGDDDRPISPPDGPADVRSRPRPSDDRTEPPQTPTAPPTGLVTMEEAVTETRVRHVRRMTRSYP